MRCILFVFLILFSLPHPAEAQEAVRKNNFLASTLNVGQEYTGAYFDKLTLSDFRLGMTQQEAHAIIARDGWQGGWEEMNGPETIEQGSIPFLKGRDSTVTLYRYRTADTNEIKIYTITYVKRFTQDQSLDILTAKLIEKYGAPTNLDIKPREIVLQYSPDKDMNENHRCERDSNRIECAKFIEWKTGPKLSISVTPRMIELTLEDQTEALRNRDVIKTKRNALENDIKREGSKQVDLDF